MLPVSKKTTYKQQLYLSLAARVGLIVVIGSLMYFWGLAIVSNVANFWNIFTPSQVKNLSPDTDALPIPPTLSGLPSAVKEPKINLHGFATEGAQVTIFLNGREEAIVRADKNGEFSYDGLTLREGENEISTKAQSSNRQESAASDKIIISYVNKSPFLEVINLADRAEVSQKESNFNLSGKTSPNARVTINGSSAFVDADGNFSYTYFLAEGENNLIFEAVDEAGNKSVLQKNVAFHKE